MENRSPASGEGRDLGVCEVQIEIEVKVKV